MMPRLKEIGGDPRESSNRNRAQVAQTAIAPAEAVSPIDAPMPISGPFVTRQRVSTAAAGLREFGSGGGRRLDGLVYVAAMDQPKNR